MFGFFRRKPQQPKSEEVKPKVGNVSYSRLDAALTVLLLKYKAGRYNTEEAVEIIKKWIPEKH